MCISTQTTISFQAISFGYNTTIMTNNTSLNTTSGTVLFIFACEWNKQLAKAFDAIYINGSRDAGGVAFLNPQL